MVNRPYGSLCTQVWKAGTFWTNRWPAARSRSKLTFVRDESIVKLDLNFVSGYPTTRNTKYRLSPASGRLCLYTYTWMSIKTIRVTRPATCLVYTDNRCLVTERLAGCPLSKITFFFNTAKSTFFPRIANNWQLPAKYFLPILSYFNFDKTAFF